MRFLPLTLLAPALLLMMPLSASAETCELSISSNDQMQYDKSEMVVGSNCDEVTVELEHTGELSAQQMGHNWVLVESGDYQAVSQEGMNAGMANDYVPQDDERVIAYTEVIGGGETTSVTFDVSELESGGDYTFFCSFPGHSSVMQGELVVE